MKLVEEFRDRETVRAISRRIAALSPPSAVIMEVCGTHTMSAARYGIRSLLPRGVRLVSGPGCPVCVTSQHEIDEFLALGKLPDVALASFGDMLRVPGSTTSLERQRAEGTEVWVVYSALDAVDIAQQHPDRSVVFFGVGFETTMPSVALAIITAAERHLQNFFVFCVHKTIPLALRALLAGGVLRQAQDEAGRAGPPPPTPGPLSGLLCPGHVTTIIGADAYEFIPREFGLPCAITGFEPVDMMLGIESILRQVSEGAARVDNVYTRATSHLCNPRAREVLDEVFEPCDAEWRGLGVIAGSGALIRSKYAAHDARLRFADVLAQVPPPAQSPCRCGDVLTGAICPDECGLFGSRCTSADPVGPCMVSSEGACAAYYRYRGEPPDEA